MKQDRLRELREQRHMIQAIVAAKVGISQQSLSKYETDISRIKVDILIKLAQYYNVTSDYILGLSDMKRDLQGQMRVNKALDEYYDLVEMFRSFDIYEQQFVWNIMKEMQQLKRKRNESND